MRLESNEIRFDENTIIVPGLGEVLECFREAMGYVLKKINN
jgi:hypothetical protein